MGAGPAGLAAAIVARGLRMSTLLIEAAGAGGQLLGNDTPLLDYPGVDAPTGPELADRLRRQLERLGGEVRGGAPVRRIDAASASVQLGDATLSGSALLLATGAARRRLGVPGEGDAPGRGLSPVARRFGPTFAGRPVVVVGGGDVACEEAALLAQVCPRVVLAHRGKALRARPDFRAAAFSNPRVEVMFETRLQAILGQPEVTGARLVGPSGELTIEAAAVVICAGLAARSELVAGQVALDASGAVQVDLRQLTSSPRLYAAGDVCAGSSWTVAAAVGQAAVAVKDIERRLAAGELASRASSDWPFAPTAWLDPAS